MTNATPTKLRSGAWGARVAGAVKADDTITITTRAGKTWPARVTTVVWTDGAVSVVATESLDGGPRLPARSRAYSGGSGRCHTDGECSSMCSPSSCPCGDGSWFRCC